MQKNETKCKWAGCLIRREDIVDSTNRQTRLWAREGAPHGAVIIAKQQTAGRGRRGRAWESRPGVGLWFSIVLRPDIPDSSYSLLSFAAALAAADACREVSGADVRIKWPNDLVLLGRKITGILVEREGNAAVMGIGINVRQQAEDFAPELREKAGSLEMLTGKTISMKALEDALLWCIEQRIDNFDFLSEYTARCATIGAQVEVLEISGSYTGIAEGLDETGALYVRDDGGTLHRVLAGDVSVRGMMGYV